MAFKDAKWIQGDLRCESPLFRREFVVGQLASAKIRICGLGFFELYLNGQKVSEDLLVPAWSNYEERRDRRLLYPIHDTFDYRTYYLEYDLLAYMTYGVNAIGVWLGNGWYNQNERTVEGDLSYGFPKLCFLLEWEEVDGTKGSVASDDLMRWNESKIIFNNIFAGEVHDLSGWAEDWSVAGFDDSDWKQVGIVDSPKTNFFLQTCPADKAIRTIAPDLIYQDAKRRIYDCRENITGYAVIKSGAAPGKEITVAYSEVYLPDSHVLDFHSAGGDYDFASGNKQIQTDRYLCAEREHLCHPRFCWHGFRYFEVSGSAPAEVVEVRVVHGDFAVASSFESSNPTLNWLFDAYVRTQLGNIHCGVPSDCPQRERLGYTGDGQLTSSAAMWCLDASPLYEKWMEDIVDCQDKSTGHVQHTAPFYGGGGGPGGWGGAIVIVPWNQYLQYGDDSVLRRYFPNMLLWLEYMNGRVRDGLVTHEEEGGWCLGEWLAPNQQLPDPFVNTYFYIKALRLVLKIGAMLSEPLSEALCTRLKNSEDGFYAAYFDDKTGSFCGGVNGADAFAVDLDLGDERTLRALIERYRATKTLDTGIFGTDVLIDVLFRHDPDLAFELMTGYTSASFERMRREGATTLWEDWDGRESLNHPMFGTAVRALFVHILGIKRKEGDRGFRGASIEPAKIAQLDWARGSVQTPSGSISVEVRRDQHGQMQVRSMCSG